jgi:cell division transport system permease protein
MTQYLLRHAQVLFATLGGFARAPFATLMTVAVIGVTLALPGALYVLVHNLQRAGGGLEAGGQISLFLRADAGARAGQALAGRLRARDEIARVDYLSPEAALEEFRQASGFGAALDALERNPLPAVLVVQAAEPARAPERLRALAREFGALPEVEHAQLDLEWVQRLHALLRLAERAVWLLAGLLGLAVLLIVGNTVRLAVLARREEIAIVKLVGGTDAFIRRPFLYAGLLHGLAGAALAWLLITASLLLLGGPVAELAGLYGAEFRVSGFGTGPGLTLLALGSGLGWLGSRIAVGRHLRTVEPL